MNTYNYTTMSNTLFFDIESVREFDTFDEFTAKRNLDNWKKVAAKHYSDVLKHNEISTDEKIYKSNAALYPEYGKIVSIGFGKTKIDLTDGPAKIEKSLYDFTSTDEELILKKFAKQLEKLYDKDVNTKLCGHNVLEFDIPFLVKRMIKYKIRVPLILKDSIYGKPWEIKIVDTMRDWRMNTSKYLSLDTISEFLGIPSSKTGAVNGSNLGEYYWANQHDEIKMVEVLLNIGTYCKTDVGNTIDIYDYLASI